MPAITLAGYFEVCGLTDDLRKHKIRTIALLALSGKRSNLFEQYHQSIRDPFAEYPHLEEPASRNETWSYVVPGLLQTPIYAKAVVERSRTWQTGREIDNFVELRMARQQALTRKDPLHLWCVLDEAALHRQVGGGEVKA
ncbi:Scr1 family TA system antitoxin-like transcriptional regulator [Streptomyces paludis]|uniref:Scr1 family TA system antitoxin-like transcriptional regulator n=1 Tax=Streptomyces paludis TaxID=2282738 RepID=UPI0022B18768|nr:Scr1 family TA system antitoxin-like transcriptional regulator [Streptomyces paludis]